MAIDATGTPTDLGIPKFNPTTDAPSGLGFNAAMDAIDSLIAGRIELPASPTLGDTLVWNGSAWVADEPAAGGASVTPVSLTTPGNNSLYTVVGLTAWSAGHWEWNANVDGEIYGNVLVPAGVTSATLRLAIGANATTGVTRLSASYAPVADTETLNPASLTAVAAQDITVPGTAYLRKDVTFALTGLTAGDLIIVKLTHEGAHANDSLASANTLLFGAWLEP